MHSYLATCRCVRRCECRKTGKFIFKDNLNKNNRIKITKRTKIAFRAKKIPLDQVALLFNKLLPNTVLLPVTKINTKVTKHFKNSEIRILRSLGLIIK